MEEFIDVNIPEVVQSLERFKRDQLPFATASALTASAKDGQQEVQRQLGGRFTIRRKWVERGVRIQAATKRRPTAAVFSRDDFMLKQERGSVERRVSIPEGVRRNRRTVVSRGRWPGALLKRPDVFVRRLPRGAKGVFRRMKSGRLKLLWVIEDVARVEPRWGFVNTVRKKVAKNWEKNFGRALARALRTAR